MEPVGQHILRWLADRPGQRFSYEHLATVFSEELAQSQSRRTVREHIDLANEISTSFGRVRLVDIDDDTCRTESLLYAGFQQRGSRFVLAGDDPTDPVEWNYALGLDRFWVWQFPALPRSESDWAACVASSANPAPDVGMLANAYRGGTLPVGFGTCWDSRDLTAATQPLSCQLPHQAELIASGSVMLPDATPPVSLQGSCSRQAAKVIGRADPTAGGELTEQVLATQSDPAGAAKQVVCFVVPAQPRRLIGTLVGLRDSPILFIE